MINKNPSALSSATYELTLHPKAKKEWFKLPKVIREQFKKKLAERLENPFVPAAKLSGHANCYKIKLRSAGYRLVYKIINDEMVILVIAIGKREKDEVYKKMLSRLE